MAPGLATRNKGLTTRNKKLVETIYYIYIDGILLKVHERCQWVRGSKNLSHQTWFQLTSRIMRNLCIRSGLNQNAPCFDPQPDDERGLARKHGESHHVTSMISMI